MCGISGLFSFKKSSLDKQTILSMTNTIAHRGPDGEGYVAWEPGSAKAIRFGGKTTTEDVYNSPFSWRPDRIPESLNFPVSVAMGHRRLSIVDLSPGGYQPMKLSDDESYIVFNGEIYNYEQVREELKREGYVFFTHSDTEVILNAWKKWGTGCLEKFNGMFAFILFDPIKKSVFIARDRYGVKPLYYWTSPEGFTAFASEIKEFTVLPGWEAKLNAQRAYDFLNYAITDHTNETLFANVFQMRGGEYMHCGINELDDPRKHIRQWYHMKPATVTGSYESACEEFAALFSDSVNLRRHADVPVGTGLSGGLDSSSIVCTINELNKQFGGERNHTFTACSVDPRFDERKFAEAVIEQTNSISHYTYPQLNGFLDTFRKIIWHHDEPAVGATVFAEWEVFKLVATTPVKVTLDGHGADEQLGGYHSFFKPFFAGLFVQGDWRKMLSEVSYAKQKHKYGNGAFVKWILDSFTPDYIRQFIGSRTGKVTANIDWFETKELGVETYNLLNKLGAKTSSFRKYSEVQLSFSSLPQQLRWCDRDSMAHSIESRAPFLDYRVLEFSLGCKTEFKMDQATTKKILRDSMKQRLPQLVGKRQDKMGFVTPEFAWIREDAPERFLEMVHNAIGKTKGVLNTEAENKAIDIILGKRPFDFFVWRLLFFAEWMEIFNVKV